MSALTPTNRAGPYQDRDGKGLPPELLESYYRDLSTKLMRKHLFFRRPYHFFDVLRQLRDNLEFHESEVRSIDERLVEEMNWLMDIVKVEKRSSIPGIIGYSISSSHILVQTGEDLAIIESKRLIQELAQSWDWERQDWLEMIREFSDEASKKDSLRTASWTRAWLNRDYLYVQQDYDYLRAVSGSI
jgi:hypothetical protein